MPAGAWHIKGVHPLWAELGKESQPPTTQSSRVMVDVTLNVLNVPGAGEVHYQFSATTRSPESSAATTPDRVNDTIALSRNGTTATTVEGTQTIADPLTGSIGFINLVVQANHGSLNTDMARVVNASARFTMPAADFTLTYDFATGRWTGDSLTDAEVEVTIANDLDEHRYVAVTDAGTTLAVAAVAGNGTKKIYYRPASGDLHRPTLRHSADPNNANNGDQKYLAAPKTGPATVRLSVGEGEGKQIRQIHAMMLAFLVVFCVVAFVYLTHKIFNLSWKAMGMGSRGYSRDSGVNRL